MAGSIKIWFDLDGTIFDLYHQDNWEPKLRAEESGVFTAYGETEGWLPYINRNLFAEAVQALMMEFGVEFNVITWLPMQASPEYEEVCRAEKIQWVKQNLPFVNEISCVSYGIPKQNCIKKKAQTMILLDDNMEVCEEWKTAKQRKAYQVSANNSVDKVLNQILCDLEAEYFE